MTDKDKERRKKILNEVIDEIFKPSERQKAEDYREAKAKAVKEIKEANEKAELKEVNKQLEEAGSEYIVTEKVHWRPGDPVENIGHAMLQNDWEEEFQRKAPDLFHHYQMDPVTFWRGYDAHLMEKYGLTRDEL